MMEAKDWLVLALDSQSEPIRIQKTLFKLSQEADLPASETYSFRPYNWGPYSPQISEDIDELVQGGLVERVRTPGVSWASYRLTAEGKREAAGARDRAADEALASLSAISDWVSDRAFSQLLRDLYRDYPKLASRSLFKQYA